MKKVILPLFLTAFVCLCTWVFVTQAVSQSPPPPALVGYWKFDEASCDSALDSSDFGNNGTIYGATGTTGKCGNALYFDAGSDGGVDYVVVPNSPSIDTSEFTVSCWVSLADVNRTNVILDKRNDQWDRNFGLYYYVDEPPPSEPPGNYLAILIGDGTPLNWYEYAAYYLHTPIQDQFFHIAATHHHSDGHSYLRFYHNGEMVAERELPEIIGNVGNGDLYIGTHGSPQLDMSPTNGIIDEVRIYNYALTQEQIQADMECPPVPDISGCIQLRGAPLIDVEVRLEQKDEITLTTTTHSDGCYEFETINKAKDFTVTIEGEIKGD